MTRERDLNNATLFEQPGFAEQYQFFSDNYSEFARELHCFSIQRKSSGCVVKGSSDSQSSYRTFYTLAIVFIIAFHLFTGFSRFFTERFYYVYKKETSGNTVTISSKLKKWDLIIKTILSAIFLNLAILMLLLSLDISPWSCLHGPLVGSVDYFPVTNRFSIQIDHSPVAIRFQQGASIVSLILALIWVVVHVVFYCFDYGSIEERVEC